jgi:hypothetical protein
VALGGVAAVRSSTEGELRRKAGVLGGSLVPCAKLSWSKAGVGLAGYVQLILILFAGHPHTVFAGSGGGLR